MFTGNVCVHQKNRQIVRQNITDKPTSKRYGVYVKIGNGILFKLIYFL